MRCNSFASQFPCNAKCGCPTFLSDWKRLEFRVKIESFLTALLNWARLGSTLEIEKFIKFGGARFYNASVPRNTLGKSSLILSHQMLKICLVNELDRSRLINFGL